MINFIRQVLSLLNFLFPKSHKRVVLLPFPNTEPGSINIANYLVDHSDYEVHFIVEKEGGIIPRMLLRPQVHIIVKTNRSDYRYLWQLYRSKFVFLTHGCILNRFPKRQVVVNLWHGLLYKRVGLLAGGVGLPATYTIGTSALTEPMLSAAFGVPQSSVLRTGYPRNDNLLSGSSNQSEIIRQLGFKERYDRIILWMPTYRKSVKGNICLDGVDVGNPFYIQDFDIERFNSLLKEQQTLCLVKPHPLAPKYALDVDSSHVHFIDDQWVYDRGLDLYSLVGATDLLISDVSSIIIDYLLLDKPIVCISEDFDVYGQTRGFYFEDIEDKIPTQVLRNQHEFFEFLSQLLRTGVDPYQEKREKLKDQFFQYKDDQATSRVVASTIGFERNI